MKIKNKFFSWEIHLKRRTKPIKEFEELNKAGKELCEEIFKALWIPQLAQWLENRLQQFKKFIRFKQ